MYMHTLIILFWSVILFQKIFLFIIIKEKNKQDANE